MNQKKFYNKILKDIVKGDHLKFRFESDEDYNYTLLNIYYHDVCVAEVKYPNYIPTSLIDEDRQFWVMYILQSEQSHVVTDLDMLN